LRKKNFKFGYIKLINIYNEKIKLEYKFNQKCYQGNTNLNYIFINF